MPNVLPVIASFLSNSRMGKCSGISFIDWFYDSLEYATTEESILIRTCPSSYLFFGKNRTEQNLAAWLFGKVKWSFRIRCKVFKDTAQRGKSSTGWFYGFKLHLIVNDPGEILSFMKPPGNVDDRNSKVIFPFSKNIYGKLFGDKGYISQSLFVSA